MTKIKIDIESDKDIAQANLSIKYADGCQINKEVVNSEVTANSTSSETKIKTDDKKLKKGVDAAFMQNY